MKGVSPFISFSLTFLLSIVIMGILLTTLSPYFEKAKTSAIIDEALNNLYALDKAIKEVASEGIGSQRVIDVKVSGGTYRVDNNTGTLEYTLKTSIAPFEYGITKQYGNIRLYSGGTAKVYLEDNDTVVLENRLLKIGMRAKSYEQNWTGIKWNYGCWKYYNGNNFTNIFDHLVLYLPFEENSGTATVDYSGYGNNGTIYGAKWVDGKFGKALQFDGVDDYVEGPVSNSILPGDTSFTLVAWFKTSILYSTADPSVGGRLITVYRSTAGSQSSKVGMGFYGDGTQTLLVFIKPYGKVTVPNIPFNDGEWHQMTVSYDNDTDILKIFYDGLERKSENVGTIDLAGTEPLRIGTFRPNGNGAFNGIIDGVMIFNRALNDTEIKWLYEHSKWKYQTDFLQVGFDENFVNVSDYAGNTLESIYIPEIRIDGKPLTKYFTIKNLTIYYFDWTKNNWTKFGCNNLTFEHLPELGYDWPDVDNTTGYFIDPRFKQEVILLYSWINGDKALNMTFFVTAHDPILRIKIDKSW